MLDEGTMVRGGRRKRGWVTGLRVVERGATAIIASYLIMDGPPPLSPLHTHTHAVSFISRQPWLREMFLLLPLLFSSS